MLVLVTHSFPRICIWSLSDAVIAGYFDLIRDSYSYVSVQLQSTGVRTAMSLHALGVNRKLTQFVITNWLELLV